MASASHVKVKNTTGKKASDLHITFGFTGGSLKIDPSSISPPDGNNPPKVPSNDKNSTNEGVIEWSSPVVQPGDTVEFDATTEFGPLQFISGYWTGPNGKRQRDNIGPVDKDSIEVTSKESHQLEPIGALREVNAVLAGIDNLTLSHTNVPLDELPEGVDQSVLLAKMMIDLGRFLEGAGGIILLQGKPKKPADAQEAKKRTAKQDLKDFLDRVKEKIDESKLSEDEKRRLKEKIDEAKRELDACTNEGLEAAGKALKEVYDQLKAANEEEKDNEKKEHTNEIINDLGVSQTYATMILIKSQWKIRKLGADTGYGVRDISIIERDGKCFIRVQAIKPEGYTLGIPHGKADASPPPIEVKNDQCGEARRLIEELKAKIERCDYPNLDDARRIWALIDP
ncbi:MAG: hypothetical protein HYY22_09035 [Thaumarchaeota archaeon]|nr:hypothetical protein [Nitrososphaerota archaeon]